MSRPAWQAEALPRAPVAGRSAAGAGPPAARPERPLRTLCVKNSGVKTIPSRGAFPKSPPPVRPRIPKMLPVPRGKARLPPVPALQGKTALVRLDVTLRYPQRSPATSSTSPHGLDLPAWVSHLCCLLPFPTSISLYQSDRSHAQRLRPNWSPVCEYDSAK